MIESLRSFFDLNTALVFLVYGQVFFVLGLAIAFQSRRHSRLELARSLGWLSAFGIFHGLHEWGLFFIPLQATYLSDNILMLMQIMLVTLLGLSFAFLFQFGADLLRQRWPWLLPLPPLVCGIWAVWSIIRLVTLDGSVGTWQLETSIGARYFIGFPGALLAALGLRYQADRQIRPLNLGNIYRMLRIAGLALAGYAFFAGLVVPFAAFFPANRLNDSLLAVLTGIPVPVYRSLAGLIMTVAIIRALEVFDLEVDRRIEQMEIEQSLAAERERIGRELHDGAIQQVYAAGLILESARHRVAADDLIGQGIDRAMTALNQAVASLRAYMNELRPGPADISLADGLREQAGDPRFSALMNVDVQLQLPDEVSLQPVETTHILAIVGEALSNAARHAQARNVILTAKRENGHLLLSITDDGQGFEPELDRGGFGLRNMRDRARLLGGTLSVDSTRGKGTQIVLDIPWEDA